jgi:hypothetical protein
MMVDSAPSCAPFLSIVDRVPYRIDRAVVLRHDLPLPSS